MYHGFEAAKKQGSVGRFGEESMEHYIQVVRQESERSVNIARLDLQVHNTMLRSTIKTRVGKKRTLGRIKKCKTCECFMSKNRRPTCRCINFFS